MVGQGTSSPWPWCCGRPGPCWPYRHRDRTRLPEAVPWAGLVITVFGFLGVLASPGRRRLLLADSGERHRTRRTGRRRAFAVVRNPIFTAMLTTLAGLMLHGAHRGQRNGVAVPAAGRGAAGPPGGGAIPAGHHRQNWPPPPTGWAGSCPASAGSMAPHSERA
ncbi:hypothetical protein QJS66_19515 [Kocuria rhizophila]|nr:hypothetical protein QJS66_19515 [Kocuria rhizophila]